MDLDFLARDTSSSGARQCGCVDVFGTRCCCGHQQRSLKEGREHVGRMCIAVYGKASISFGYQEDGCLDENMS